MKAAVQDDSTALEPIAKPLTPLELIAKAVESGFNADQLAKLTELAERADARRAAAEFAAAMNACQKDMPTVVRDKKNDQTNSRYPSLEAVNLTIKPAYTEHGFSLTFSEGSSPLPEHRRIVCIVRHVGGHSEQHFVDLPLDSAGIAGKINKTPIHATGSTFSYARRYLEYLIFNITIANEDTDGVPPMSKLTADQVEVINRAIEGCEKAGHKVNVPKFLEWLEVSKEGNVGDILSKDFVKAIAHLNRKERGEK